MLENWAIGHIDMTIFLYFSHDLRSCQGAVVLVARIDPSLRVQGENLLMDAVIQLPSIPWKHSENVKFQNLEVSYPKKSSRSHFLSCFLQDVSIRPIYRYVYIYLYIYIYICVCLKIRSPSRRVCLGA